MKLSSFTLLSIVLLFSYCGNPSKNNIPVSDSTKKIIDTNRIKEVSMINLIANPKEYKDYKVRVIGYLHLEFEGNGLYFHKEDYDRSINKNAIWISIDRDSKIWMDAMKCNNHYVLLEGIFGLSGGHMDLFSGSLENIKRVEIWEFPSGPPVEKKGIKFPLTK